jgi:hypothetical protein
VTLSIDQVQVIQQPYLQQYGYNAQGQPQFIMPGNIQLQSAGVNPTIQVKKIHPPHLYHA